MTAKFKDDIRACGRGDYDAWKEDHQGRLAFILLCDQYSRNVFRGTKEAFAYDHLAIALSRKIYGSDEVYNRYKNYEKMFILMPMMHSEMASDGKVCVKAFQQLADINKEKFPHLTKGFEYNKKYAVDHLAVIEKFGRYPTRNKAMGRETTKEESDYLKNADGWG